MFSNSFVKILALFTVIIVCVAIWYKVQASWYQEELERVSGLYSTSQANNNLLIKKVKDIYNDKRETERQNALLEQAAEKEDKTHFDWHADIANSSVIKQLQAD